MLLVTLGLLLITCWMMIYGQLPFLLLAIDNQPQDTPVRLLSADT